LLSRGSLGFTGFATITHPYDQRVVPGKVPGAQCYEPNDPISSRSKVPIVAVHSESKSTVAHAMASGTAASEGSHPCEVLHSGGIVPPHCSVFEDPVAVLPVTGRPGQMVNAAPGHAGLHLGVAVVKGDDPAP